MFHALFALCFIGAYVSADSERWRVLHVTLGYTLAGLLVFRLLYGLFGPRPARLRLLFARLKPARTWLGSLLAWVRRDPAAPTATALWRQTEHLALGVALVGLLVTTVPLTVSGVATYFEWGGKWFEDLHEASGDGMLALALTHVGVLALMAVLRRKNTARPMWDGRIAGRGPDLVTSNRGWLAALILGAVLAFWGWSWQQAQATGTDLLPNAMQIKTPADGRAEAQARRRKHDHDAEDERPDRRHPSREAGMLQRVGGG
jgi:cytochrome b